MGNSKLIERLRPKEKDYTKGERPVTWKEVQEIRPEFSRVVAKPYHIASRLRRRIPLLNRPTVKRFDHAVLSALPFMRHLASGVVIYLEKPIEWAGPKTAGRGHQDVKFRDSTAA